MADETVSGTPRTLRPRWGGAVLVCGKCLKRHHDGKALRRALNAEVKARAPGDGTRRKARIVKTACVGLCPKRAVVLASAASLSAGEVVLARDAREIAGAVPKLLPREGR